MVQRRVVKTRNRENPMDEEVRDDQQASTTSAGGRPRRRRAAGRPAGPPEAHPQSAPAESDTPAEDSGEPETRPADLTPFVPAPVPAVPVSATDPFHVGAFEPVPEEVADLFELDEEDAITFTPVFLAPEIDAEEVEVEKEPAGRRTRNRKPKQQPGKADVTSGDGDDKQAKADKPSKSGAPQEADADADADQESSSRRRRRRRRRGAGGDDADEETSKDEVTSVKGSTRLEAKRQRRREGRDAGRRRSPIVSEAEFLARRESVDRVMVVRGTEDRTQIAVLEDKILVEHYVTRERNASMIGNVYLGKVQNVLPSMEAAFIDIGRGRNAVLYAGEVNWEGAGLEGQPKRIELALQPGDSVLVQVTKDPVGHKGARLTSQISLPGRYLVYVPNGRMTGISRKLPDKERTRLKKALRAALPEDAGVIVRTAAEGATEEQLASDVNRLAAQWDSINEKTQSAKAPSLLNSEPDLAIRVVRDIFNEDFHQLIVAGSQAQDTIEEYVKWVAPELAERVSRWTGADDVFAHYRVDEQITKALDRKVLLPSGGSLVIDRTEAMTVVDVNTGRFIGQGGNLEETVTRNNLEAAEEIVRQLRLRDIGGIIVVDFIDMVLESNRDLVVRRLVECLGRDRTKHQVAEITSLGLVQMTRKRLGQGLLETFSEPCEHCNGRGVRVQTEPVGSRRRRPPGPIPGAPAKKAEDGESGEQEQPA
ncbi:MAG: Rne/Rng family ribonuclease [Candidatus Nanopelagicales bacterium]